MIKSADNELSAIQRSIDRGCPFGDNSWLAEAAKALGFEITTRPRGRPSRDPFDSWLPFFSLVENKEFDDESNECGCPLCVPLV
jgi:hypothetical protein